MLQNTEKQSFMAAIISPGRRQLTVTSLSHSTGHGKPAPVSTVAWDDIPVSRKSLYFACHGAFLHAQQIRGGLKSISTSAGPGEESSSMHSMNLKPYLTVSQAYRRELWQFLEQQAYQSVGNDIDSEISTEIQSEIVRLWNMHRALHLAEILILNDTPNDFIMDKMLEWAYFGSSEMSNIQGKVKEVLASVIPLNHKDLWPAIQGLAARARFEDLLRMINRLLPQNADSDQNIAFLQKMIARAPSLRILKTSEGEYIGRWKLWQSEISSSLSRVDSPGLKETLLILSGDDLALKRHCSNWREYLVFSLYHKNPTLQAHQLEQYIKDIKTDSVYDQLQLAIIRMDLTEAIRHAAEIDPWFVAIFTDLVDAVGKLDSSPIAGEVSLRDYLLMNYGGLMAGDDELWEVGLDCLGFCGIVGQDFMREHIVHIYIKDEEQYERLVAFCQRMGLHRELKQINLIAARNSLSRKDYGRAVVQYMEANEPTYLQDILERVIEEYLTNGTADFDGILNLARPYVNTTSQLLFLDSFSGALTLLQDGEKEAAAHEFVMLLNSDLAPMKFWSVLLMECLKLMEDERKGANGNKLFSQDDLFDIMRCIEDVTMSYRSNEYLEFAGRKYQQNGSIDCVKKDFQRLRRLLLTQGLW